MHLRFPRGTQKPPLGALIDPNHPLSRGHMFSLLFNEGFDHPQPVVSGLAPFGMTDGGPSTAWVSNQIGYGLNFTAVSDYVQIGTGSAWLPTSAITVLCIRRKNDATLRASRLFETGTSGSGLIGAHCPYSDGVVYWDFGTFSAPNRLSVSGLSFSTVVPERWIFTAGPAGSNIWQNGVKVASQSTAITRAASSTNLYVGNGISLTAADFQQINFFAMHSAQWTDDLCRWWSSEPFAHFYPQPSLRREWLFQGGDASTGALASSSVGGQFINSGAGGGVFIA